MREDEIERADDYEGPLDLPDDFDAEDEGDVHPRASLTDDLTALFEDGKTYAEAELQYQKSRAAYSANRIKYALVYGAGAFAILHMALIGLTVGAVIALAPLVGPWLATLIVVGLLVLGGVILLRKLKGKIDDVRWAFRDEDEGGRKE